ncbi:hypothetical protein ACW9YQ_05725 [Paraburkholderia strydomiana]|uniref:hypothetical protein n=1 Tax=Paraburkholderia strydomiana TaxID=1245417 RepID=UPI00285BB407|nr:hypothetical protein [Paraburkholderia strydomiana]MDR7009272.1 hypothetical protein [Paraburkholderia strydomiana]
MTEESYKRLANSVREVTGVDATPEAWKEIINGYMIGPLTGIAMTFNEPGEKGPAPTNREQLGLWDAFGASRMLKKNAREVETLFYTEARPEERDIPGRSGRYIQVAPVPRVHRSDQSRSARPGESLPRQRSDPDARCGTPGCAGIRSPAGTVPPGHSTLLARGIRPRSRRA